MRYFNFSVTMIVLLALVVGVMGCSKPAPAPSPTPAPAPAAKPSPAPAPAPAPSPKPAASPAPTAKPAASPTAAAAPVGGQLTKSFVFVASAGGKAYIYSASLSELLNRYGGLKSEVQSVPGAAEKFSLIEKGTAHSVVWSPTEPLFSYRGQQGYKPTKLRNLISSGFPASIFAAFMTTPATGIKTVKDLKGKKLLAEWTGQAWFGMFSEALLKSNGMTKADVKWLTFGDNIEAFRELREGRADAIMNVFGANTRELAQSKGMFVIPMTAADQTAINELLGGFTAATVPKDHEGANADTPVMGSDTCVWVYPTLSDISAYTVVKTLFEHLSEFQGGDASSKGFTLQNATKVWALPYHPGAIAYYKEKGVWGPEQDKKQDELLKEEARLYK